MLLWFPPGCARRGASGGHRSVGRRARLRTGLTADPIYGAQFGRPERAVPARQSSGRRRSRTSTATRTTSTSALSGTTPQAMFGVPPHRTVNLINLDVLYGISNRLSLDVTVPFVIGSAAVATTEAHDLFKFKASGLGDISLPGRVLALGPRDPFARHRLGRHRLPGADGQRQRASRYQRRNRARWHRSTSRRSWARAVGHFFSAHRALRRSTVRSSHTHPALRREPRGSTPRS